MEPAPRRGRAARARVVSGLDDARRDRLVATAAFNLPTGTHALSTSQFRVAAAVGSSYLSFPVASFGTAFGVTVGLAYAERVGTWSVGGSGSLRYLGSYQPFANDTLLYRPGVEWRLRAGIDRLLGPASRLLLGLTVSTFSTDVYSGASALLGGSYRPRATSQTWRSCGSLAGRACRSRCGTITEGRGSPIRGPIRTRRRTCSTANSTSPTP